MNKTLIKKLTQIISLTNQKTGILSFLKEGNSASVNDFRSAGISDPLRVIRFLRSDGHNIVKQTFINKGRHEHSYMFVKNKRNNYSYI